MNLKSWSSCYFSRLSANKRKYGFDFADKIKRRLPGRMPFSLKLQETESSFAEYFVTICNYTPTPSACN
jgi:hypothetical protein